MNRETYIKELQKILDNENTKQELLHDLKIVSGALLGIVEQEGCEYGFGKACEIAEKYAYIEEGEA